MVECTMVCYRTFYYSDLNHPVTKLQPNMKGTPYFSFRRADIIASHLKKTKSAIEADDNEVCVLKLNVFIQLIFE